MTTPTESPDAAKVASYLDAVRDLDAAGILKWADATFGDKVVFATSLGVEDQALTYIIQKEKLSTPIFTLDTGRLFNESYQLIDATEMKYHLKIRIYFPDRDAVEDMVAEKGVNLFLDSIENRKQCCGVRKIAPLRRALAGNRAWITGLRAAQSVTRTALQPVEWDAGNNMIKINPLYAWSEDETWDFVRANKVPYNKLHDQGFLSIGCASCTRAVAPGEDVRAGRWWWENPEQKECGLHSKP